MPRKAGGTRRKRRTHKLPKAAREGDKIPRSFVFRRGQVPVAIRDLVPEIRTALMPHTAMHLKERKTNSIRDFVSVATQIGVTHFWIFSATQKSPFLRIARVPQGPTLNFRIAEYTLSTDVRGTQRRPMTLEDRDFEQPPLLVLNNFSNSEDSEVKLMAETFRHSFPPLNVNTIRLSTLRRVLLVNRDVETGLVHMRHYALKVQQAGLSRPVRKMVNKRRIPKMANLTDVAQLMDGAPGIFSSDSEMEEPTDSLVTLSQPVQKLKTGSSSKVRLVEVGPRLTLELVKVQAGMCDGAVLYHRLFTKTEEEAKEDERRVRERIDLKRKRREQQEENVRRKKEVKRAKKDRHRKNIEARTAAEEAAANSADDTGDEADVEDES